MQAVSIVDSHGITNVWKGVGSARWMSGRDGWSLKFKEMEVPILQPYYLSGLIFQYRLMLAVISLLRRQAIQSFGRRRFQQRLISTTKVRVKTL